MSEICEEAEIPRRTNHSLRATGATALLQSNMPEKIIQKTTGHSSIEALSTYVWTSEEQHVAVSKVMMSTKMTTYEGETKDNASKISMPSTTSNSSTRYMERVYGDFSNCTIGSRTINIGP